MTAATESPGRVRSDAALAAALTAAFLGTWLALLPAAQLTLALRVQQVAPGSRAATLSLLLTAGAVAALLVQNVVGALSDRTTGRFGMRRPWLVAGAVLGLGGLALLASASSVALLLVGWVLVQVTFNVVLAALNPVLPDQVPPARLGRVSALVGLTQPVATAGGTALAALLLPNLTLALVGPGLVTLVTVGVLVLVLRDRTLTRAERRPFRTSTLFAAYWTNPRTAPDFGWAWLSRLLVFCGVASILGYQTYYLQDRFGYTPATVPAVVAVATAITTVTAVVSSLACGVLSDRLRRRRAFVTVSVLVLAAGLVVAAAAPTVGVFFLAVGITGVAYGGYIAVDLALVTEVLPDRADAAKDMGVFHLATVLPQSFVPAVAPLLLAIGGGSDNYTALFVAGALAGVLGAVCNTRIRGVR